MSTAFRSISEIGRHNYDRVMSKETDWIRLHFAVSNSCQFVSLPIILLTPDAMIDRAR